jgi:hypothetical protein
MGGSIPAGVSYSKTAMLPPPNPQFTYNALKASTQLGAGGMESSRKNLQLAAATPPQMLEYNAPKISQQAYEFGLQNVARSREGEQILDPALARMRLGLSERFEQAHSKDEFKSFMDRWAKERGISSIAASGIDPASTVGRSAIYDEGTEAGRKFKLDSLAALQGYVSGTPAPSGGIDPGSLINGQEAAKAANVGQMNQFQQQQMSNAFGLNQDYMNWINKMMGETISGTQAEQQNLRNYQEMVVNDIVERANAENLRVGMAKQGDQQMTGQLVGAGLGAAGLIAAVFI